MDNANPSDGQPDSAQAFDVIAFAWKVHDALDAWTAKVDSKASIVLAAETGALGITVALSDQSGPLGDLRDTSLLLYRSGVGVLVAAILLAGAAVIPQLRRRASKKEWHSNSIYFGHLRHWDAVALAKRLHERLEAMTLDELARQHVRMARIAWRKHSLLQISMLVMPVGTLLIALSAD